jgi:transcriptional antiterminator RfaH
MSGHLNLWQKASWFAIQTKAHQEFLAAARMAKLDLDTFLPQIRMERFISGRVHRVAKALFPGYFFSRFCPLECLEAVRYTHGVLRVVSSGQFPIPVEPAIIANIRDRIQPDGFVGLEDKCFKPGDKVVIEEGPFQGWMGEVQREQQGGRRVTILLGAIHQAALSVEKRWLAAVSSAA